VVKTDYLAQMDVEAAQAAEAGAAVLSLGLELRAEQEEMVHQAVMGKS
jgi:hypothetical protein